MAYLGYDPIRVEALGEAMRCAVYGLWFVGSGDPLGGVAVDAVADARRQLSDVWIPLVDRIKGATAMTLLTSFHLDSDDLLDAVLLRMTTEHGWQVIADVDLLHPASGAEPGPLSVTETTTLAELLQSDDTGRFTDDAGERTWLAGQLTMIAADPQLAAAFGAALTNWSGLIDRLGSQRLPAAHERTLAKAPDEQAAADVQVDTIDRVDGGLARVYAALHGEGALPDLGRVAPYAGAAFIARAGLTPARLADAGFQLLGRVVDERPVMGWSDEVYPGGKAADLLFAAVLATPGSTTPFVIAAAGDPQRLWWTAGDATLAQQVALSGTNPANITVADAETVVLSSIEYIRGHAGDRYDEGYVSAPAASRPFLGELVAPWLLQFSPFSPEWGSAPDEQRHRRDLLDWVLSSDDSRDRLLGAQQATQDGLVASAQRSPAALSAYAGLLGMMTDLIVGRSIKAEEDRKQLWDTVWQFVDVAVAVALVATEVPLLVRPLIKGAMDAGYEFIVDQGWLDAPAPKKVAAKEKYWQARTFTAAAAVMVRSGYARMVAAGRLPPDAPPPPDPHLGDEHPALAWVTAFDTWRDHQLLRAGGADPGAISELDELKGYFLSDTQAAAVSDY